LKQPKCQEKYEKGLEKTRKSFSVGWIELFCKLQTSREVSLEELEEILIGARFGYEASMELVMLYDKESLKLKNARVKGEVQTSIYLKKWSKFRKKNK